MVDDVKGIEGSAKLICEYCQRWQVRRYRGAFYPGGEEDLGDTMFYPFLKYRCPSCGTKEFTYVEPNPKDVETLIEGG